MKNIIKLSITVCLLNIGIIDVLCYEQGDNITKSEISSQYDFVDSLRTGFEKEIDGYKYYFRLIENPPLILKKVLPNVFFYTVSIADLSSSKTVGAYYNDQKINPVADFNNLHSISNTNHNVTIEDKVKALLFLISEFEQSVDLIRIENKKIEVNYQLIYSAKPNYEITAKIDGKIKTFYAFIDGEDIKSISELRQNTLYNTSIIE